MKINKAAALITLSIAFLLSVFIRWSAFDRPASFHHEYNTAFILMGLDAWEEIGGASVTHFVPLISYTHQADKRKPDGVIYDHQGYKPYLSFGPAWFVVPYLIFKLFNAENNPLNLHLLNLFFQALTLLSLIRLTHRISGQQKNYFSATLAGLLFIFISAGWSWYFGNGYINLTIASPVLLTLVYELFPMFEAKDMKLSQGIRIFFLGALLIYFDWIAIFLLCILLLRQISKGFGYLIKNKWLWTLTAGVTTGLILIAYQYISYAGIDFTLSNLKYRFISRSANGIMSTAEFWNTILNHIKSMYLEILCLLLIAFVYVKTQIGGRILSIPQLLAIGTLFLSALFMQIVFIQWTYVHEFSFIYIGFPILILLSVMITRILENTTKTNFSLWLGSIGIWIIVALVHYFTINPSGEFSSSGIRYDVYKRLGEQIASQSKDNEAIYLNENDLVMSFYYAKRNFIYAETLEDAQRLHQRSSQVKKGIWFEHQNQHIKRAVRFEKKD